MTHATKRGARTGARLCFATAVSALTGLAALTGCGRGGPAPDDGARPPEEVITVVPRDGARGVRAADALTVDAPGGKLERVRVAAVADGDERTVPGRISADGRRWRPTGPAGLRLAAKYTVDAVARDERGHRAARHTAFTTYVPEHRFIGYFRPEDRSTVGTGMIVSLDFNRPVTDRAAVERAVRVTAEPRTEVAAHWFGPGRLDFRPRAYWKPGTKVTLDLRLRDVRGAARAYGIQQKKVAFTIGRSQVSTVDAAAHTMTVVRDGRRIATLPVTAGGPKNPTYNGKLVVSEKYDVTRMNGDTVGFGGEYDIEDVPHAMRLTASGTFLHGNYWAPPGTFGSANTSHGCVGLRDEQGGSPATPAGWFFGKTLIGDVVEVVNSRDGSVAPDNGLSGWNMPWERWRAGSALR
ncbi:L,D-transpeptidase [Streptomyces varsoviensis]|nr:Ig-like domain-containing protein [Streptomyces varsoviensis]